MRLKRTENRRGGDGVPRILEDRRLRQRPMARRKSVSVNGRRGESGCTFGTD